MVRIVRRYTEDFKQETIKLALKSPNVDSTAKELDIPGATLQHSWISKLKNAGSLDKVDLSNSKSMADLIIRRNMKPVKLLNKVFSIILKYIIIVFDSILCWDILHRMHLNSNLKMLHRNVSTNLGRKING